MTSICEICPTCTCAKQTKVRDQLPKSGQLLAASEPILHTAKTAKHPCRGLSMDFLFSGAHSSDRREDFEGINGKMAQVLVTNHFTSVEHGDTCVSKAAPVLWLRHFLAHHNPPCDDEGGELFSNLEGENLLTKSDCATCPTGADSLSQNGPTEQGHCLIADTMRAILIGVNMAMKFWPCAFCHTLIAQCNPQPQ